LVDICQKAVKGNKILAEEQKPQTQSFHHPRIGAMLQQLNAQAPKTNLLNKPNFMTLK